jgi:cell division protein FtsQ
VRGKSSVLSPRGSPAAFEDLASRERLIAGQRIGRFAARRAGRRGRRWARRAAGLAALLVMAGAAAGTARWLLTSPRFAVARIDVVGAGRASREEILAAAGLAPGMSLFRVSPPAVAAALEALPLIRRAEVIRRFPDRVTVVVEERRPFTLVHAGRLYWIDEHGVSLGPETRAVSPGAPVISGLTAEDLAAGTRAPSARVAAGISLVRILLRSGSALLHQISEIDVSRPEGPVLYTVDGVEVRIGQEDWEARLGRLLGVLAQLRSEGEGVTSIDLRFRDQVVLRTAGK